LLTRPEDAPVATMVLAVDAIFDPIWYPDRNTSGKKFSSRFRWICIAYEVVILRSFPNPFSAA
jgi:hypothetical protein